MTHHPAALLTLGLVTLAAVASAQGVPSIGGPIPSFGPPLLLKLDGVVQPSAAAARGAGFTVTSLAFLGDASDRRRFLGVTKARTVGGDHPLDGKDVLAVVEPFNPNFLVTGPEELVSALRDAAPGTAVRIEGLVNRGSRTYYLRRVEIGQLKD